MSFIQKVRLCSKCEAAGALTDISKDRKLCGKCYKLYERDRLGPANRKKLTLNRLEKRNQLQI